MLNSLFIQAFRAYSGPEFVLQMKNCTDENYSLLSESGLFIIFRHQ